MCINEAKTPNSNRATKIGKRSFGSSMTIKHSHSANAEITREEFKEWLKTFDVDGDGRISRTELRNAIRTIRVRFSGWKSGRGLQQADANHNGFIDDTEIENLINFAQRKLGMKITIH